MNLTVEEPHNILIGICFWYQNGTVRENEVEFPSDYQTGLASPAAMRTSILFFTRSPVSLAEGLGAQHSRMILVTVVRVYR